MTMTGALARRFLATQARRSPRTRALALLGCAVLLFAVVALLGVLVVNVLSHGPVGRADRSVDNWLARHRTGSGNTVTKDMTYVADTPTVVVLAVLLAIGAGVVWHRWRDAVYVVVVLVGEVTIFVLVTAVVHRARPGMRLDHAPPTSSFPSGHVAAAVALYGSAAVLAARRTASLVWRRVFATTAVVIATCVAVARLYRGMHFPTDVIAGALLGGLWLFLVTRILVPGDRR